MEAHGTALHGLGQPQRAAEAFAEGLRAIRPFVQALPAAFRVLADALWRGYLQACKEVREEPNAELAPAAQDCPPHEELP